MGLFVPKPSAEADCQRGSTSDLETIVRQRLLASTAGDGDCHSFGHSVAVCRQDVGCTKLWRLVH